MADGNITVTVISRPPTPPGWSDTDWLRHLESCLPIGYAVRDTLYGTSKAGVLRLCSSTEAGAFAIYAAPQQPMHCPKDGGECGAGGYCRPEQRKPLTRDELLSLWKQHGYKSAMCEPFARAVEEAHGITGEPE